jgi:hypothetical protein
MREVDDAIIADVCGKCTFTDGRRDKLTLGKRLRDVTDVIPTDVKKIFSKR